MITFMEIKENNKQTLLDSLKSDPVKHAFALYDLQHDFEHTIVHMAFENEKLRGYILVYTALDWISIILECENSVADKLIEQAPENRFIMHAPPELLPIIKAKFPNAKHYVESWMVVKKGEVNLFKSPHARNLCTEKDGAQLAKLLSTRKDRPETNAKKCYELICRMPTYGVFIDNELVSYAGSFIQMPQIWLIGGVYTNPKHRNRGYATLATSAVTEEALKNAETAALFARIDNYPALRAYEKIGYRKIGEKLWVDVGTGMMP